MVIPEPGAPPAERAPDAMRSEATLLLSDLHLPDEPSPLRECFLAFLAGPARKATAVYLLGDVFEVWIGDREGLSAYAREAAALRALRDHGVPVYYLHGNRDFMVGQAFADAAGMTVLGDPLVVDLAGTPTLLSHGDVWCTDDLAYQRWRRFSRRPVAQFVYRNLPRSTRQSIAGSLRGQSQRAPVARREIMDVNADAIRQAFAEFGVHRIIHGHTHRPACHLGEGGRADQQRIVLADWRPDCCEVLRVDRDGWTRVRLPLSSVA